MFPYVSTFFQFFGMGTPPPGSVALTNEFSPNTHRFWRLFAERGDVHRGYRGRDGGHSSICHTECPGSRGGITHVTYVCIRICVCT